MGSTSSPIECHRLERDWSWTPTEGFLGTGRDFMGVGFRSVPKGWLTCQALPLEGDFQSSLSSIPDLATKMSRIYARQTWGLEESDSLTVYVA